MGRGRMVRRSVAAAALVAAVCVGSTGSATGQQGCVSPYPPLQAAEPYSVNPMQPRLELPGTAVPSRPMGPGAPTTPSAVPVMTPGFPQTPAATLTVSFPAGPVELSIPSPGAQLSGVVVGDLDADGVSDVVALRWASTEITEAFLVRSTTAPGSYDPTVIGTRLPAGLPFGNVDWPHDGSLDLTMRVGAVGGAFTGSTTIVDGAAVLAAGPGGDASGAVLASIGGVPLGVLGYPSGELLATLEVAPDSGMAVVRLADRSGTIELATTPPGASFDLNTPVSGSVHEQRRFVRVASDTRSGYRAWIWALDDPCAPIAAAAAPATRVPAQREAGLRFTG